MGILCWIIILNALNEKSEHSKSKTD